MVAERGKAEACQKEELCCSRHWMNTLLGNLKREEAGQHEMPVRPILLPPCFSDPPGLKEAKGSESAGTKGRKTCVLVLSVHAFKLWIPVFLQRKEEAQSHLFFFFSYFGWWTDSKIQQDLLAPDYKLLHLLPAFFQISHSSLPRRDEVPPSIIFTFRTVTQMVERVR